MVFSKCDFLIAAPAYSSRSGGIMVLHELCTALNRLGYRAGMLLIVEGSQSYISRRHEIASKAYE